MRIARVLSVVVLLGHVTACGVHDDPGNDDPSDAVPVQGDLAEESQPATPQVVQSLPYCYGSWRGTAPPYSHYQNLRIGGALTPGTSTAMLNECKGRIKLSTTWKSTICAGLPAWPSSWTVQTHVGVRQCFNPDDLTTCLPEMGTGFSSQCLNGVLQP